MTATQDPTLRARALLKGATRPVRIFVGSSRGNGEQPRLQIAALTKVDIIKCLPSSELTVAPDAPIEQVADAIQSAWAALRTEAASQPITSTPRRSHQWRAPNFARRNPC